MSRGVGPTEPAKFLSRFPECRKNPRIYDYYLVCFTDRLNTVRNSEIQTLAKEHIQSGKTALDPDEFAAFRPSSRAKSEYAYYLECFAKTTEPYQRERTAVLAKPGTTSKELRVAFDGVSTRHEKRRKQTFAAGGETFIGAPMRHETKLKQTQNAASAISIDEVDRW